MNILTSLSNEFQESLVEFTKNRFNTKISKSEIPCAIKRLIAFAPEAQSIKF